MQVQETGLVSLPTHVHSFVHAPADKLSSKRCLFETEGDTHTHPHTLHTHIYAHLNQDRIRSIHVNPCYFCLAHFWKSSKGQAKISFENQKHNDPNHSRRERWHQAIKMTTSSTRLAVEQPLRTGSTWVEWRLGSSRWPRAQSHYVRAVYIHVNLRDSVSQRRGMAATPATFCFLN